MSPRTTFVPRADIYETDEDVTIIVEMPGVSEDSIEISLEKNILAINAKSTFEAPDGYTLAFAEYEAGDYERSFRITDQINRDKIDASFKAGVLSLILPKAEKAKVQKITVKPG
ncbi:MAG TPA: Hsp20/alpha crystallin family protein [Chloroflexi bacterium]|nr:Hsp20/alpha crystallin family protein [Chloroflexota bacterium]